MKERVILMSTYSVAAFLTGDWAFYLETYSEASAQPKSFSVYWLGLSALLFALAALIQLIQPRLGLKIGLGACGITCPLVLFAFFRSWSRLIPRNGYEFCVEGSVVIVAIATVASIIIFKRQLRPHSLPLQSI
ncbi:MAG TPA: hypothetical protein VGN44_17270 [Candidatus Angelobacter sp.]|jgi:hypothetical protein